MAGAHPFVEQVRRKLVAILAILGFRQDDRHRVVAITGNEGGPLRWVDDVIRRAQQAGQSITVRARAGGTERLEDQSGSTWPVVGEVTIAIVSTRTWGGRIRRVPATLSSCTEPPATLFDVALLDLDGVVYVGKDAVPGAPEALRSARTAGMRLAFVTNNAARPPVAVAEHLCELGISARAEEVITSSHAAAHYLSDVFHPERRCWWSGRPGLIEALLERGLKPVHSADDRPVAVVQGYSPDLDWRQLAEGAIAIRRGALWVATNLDPTVPSPRGPLPGNGSLVAALRHATGATPVATGKPDPRMHRESVLRSRARCPIVVGDRLDTDIEGATAVGCPSCSCSAG